MSVGAHVDGIVIKEFGIFENTFFTYKGVKWFCTEQAYQASKFIDKEYQEKIRKTINPLKIIELGLSQHHLKKPNFDQIKEMTRIMWAKIVSDPRYVQLLVATKGTITFPDSDSFWGTDKGFGGENQLGNILMRIREILRKFYV